MAITYSNTGVGYNQCNIDYTTKGKVKNTYSIPYLLSSITVSIGTGNPSYGYYNYKTTSKVYGNGTSIKVSVQIGSKTPVSNTVTVTKKVGSLSETGTSDDGMTVPVWYYPKYSDCAATTFTFSTPITLAANTEYDIKLKVTSTGTASKTCLVWNKNYTITGVTAPAYKLRILDSDGVAAGSDITVNSSLNVTIPSDLSELGNFEPPEGYHSPLGEGIICLTNKTNIEADSGFTPGQTINLSSSRMGNTTSWVDSGQSVAVLAPLWYKDVTVHTLNGDSTVQGRLNCRSDVYTVVFDGEASPGNGWNFKGYSTSNNASTSAQTATENVYYGMDAAASPRNYVAHDEASDWYPVFDRTITLQYDGNGATSGSVASQTATQSGVLCSTQNVSSVSFVLQQNGFVKSSGTFNGWLIDGNLLQPSSSYAVTLGYNVSPAITAYASWDVKITYNINYTGASSKIEDYVSPTGGVYSATLRGGDTFTRTGYKLIGWNTNSSGTGTKYSLNQSITLTGELILFAVWYQLFSWTSNDAANIISGNPTTTALAVKWNAYANAVKSYISSSYSTSTKFVGYPMLASDVNNLPSGLSVGSVTKGAVVNASKFTELKTKLNDNATYLK